jgi:hypothetical protein
MSLKLAHKENLENGIRRVIYEECNSACTYLKKKEKR